MFTWCKKTKCHFFIKCSLNNALVPQMTRLGLERGQFTENGHFLEWAWTKSYFFQFRSTHKTNGVQSFNATNFYFLIKLCIFHKFFNCPKSNIKPLMRRQHLFQLMLLTLLLIWTLTLSWRRSLSYRNQSIDLLCKSMDWFLYDRDLRMKELILLASDHCPIT